MESAYVSKARMTIGKDELTLPVLPIRVVEMLSTAMHGKDKLLFSIKLTCHQRRTPAPLLLFPFPAFLSCFQYYIFGMFPLQLLTVFASAALLVSASPAFKDQCCDTSAAKLDLPSNQNALVTPTTAPLFVTLGVGVQNYTCNASTLTYTFVAAPSCTIDLTYLFI
jgi:hypothetical protein